MRNLEDETIFALREAEGWRLYGWLCSPQALPLHLAAEGLGDKECREIAHHRVIPAVREFFWAEYAMGEGWQQIPGTELWCPMDEPLPPLPGEAAPGSVAISLDRISFSIYFSVESDGVRIPTFIDDIDDSLTLWILFFNLLEGGGFPHAALCCTGPAHFIVQPGASPDECRFYLRNYGEDGVRTLDVVVPRAALIEQFRSFLTAIADHPLFAHSFLCSFHLPDELVEPVEKAAEEEWSRLVATQGIEDESGEAEGDFVNFRIAEAVPIPESSLPWVQKFQNMLRTQVIPQDWR